MPKKDKDKQTKEKSKKLSDYQLMMQYFLKHNSVSGLSQPEKMKQCASVYNKKGAVIPLHDKYLYISDGKYS